MFGKDFYPTPSNLAWDLCDGVVWGKIKTVLEPGAGKGDLAIFLKNRLGKDDSLDCIEIVPELQAVLRDKGLRVIHDDFLTFHTAKKYDLIAANFPFSDGEHHLLHALRMIEKNGGILAAYVNAETLKNPYTQARRECLNMIEELCGEITYIANGFKTAERPTGVEIARVFVSVELIEQPSIILNGLRASDAYKGRGEGPTELARGGYLEQLVQNFAIEAELGTKLIEEWFGMKPYLRTTIKMPDDKYDYSSEMLKLQVNDRDWDMKNLTTAVNAYLQQCRRKYWTVLIRDKRFTASYTSKILEELNKKLDELQDLDFTMFNIQQLGRELFQKVSTGIEDAIMSLFEDFSSRWAYYPEMKKNVWYYNGWKSNKAHKINERVIMPINGFWSYSNKTKLDSHECGKRLEDLVKVFNVLAAQDGITPDARQLVGNEWEAARTEGRFDLNLQYFTVKFYKKGTCHIHFKNKRLLEKLNIYGSQRKNWLPPNYGKAPYDAMTTEEKAVVDEFQGREAYEKVFEQKSFYLMEPGRLMLGAGFGV